jgi:hypothetical protein
MDANRLASSADFWISAREVAAADMRQAAGDRSLSLRRPAPIDGGGGLSGRDSCREWCNHAYPNRTAAISYVKGGVAWERDRYDTYFGPLTTQPGVTFSTASETRQGYKVVTSGVQQLADIRERKSAVKAGLNWRFDWAQPVVAKY